MGAAMSNRREIVGVPTILYQAIAVAIVATLALAAAENPDQVIPERDQTINNILQSHAKSSEPRVHLAQALAVAAGTAAAHQSAASAAHAKSKKSQDPNDWALKNIDPDQRKSIM